MLKRTISGVAVAAVFILCISLQGIYIKVAAVFISLISEYEILRAAKKGGIVTIDLPLYFFAAALLPAYLYFGLEGVVLAYALCLIVLFIVRILSRRYDYPGFAASALTMLYPQILFVFLYMILCIKDPKASRLILVLSVVSAAGSDTFAYFTGSLLGKRKLCPKISPNKTFEGAAGGLMGGILLGTIIALPLGKAALPIYAYILAAAVFAALSQFGDLAASVIKRHFGVKDYGTMLAGHGGMLDRVCSILFVLPAAWIFFRIFF